MKNARKTAISLHFPFTSACCLPYHDLDPATRSKAKQKRAAMF
jgi:hypothetical protein